MGCCKKKKKKRKKKKKKKEKEKEKKEKEKKKELTCNVILDLMTFTNYSAGSEAKEGIRDLKTYSRGY